MRGLLQCQLGNVEDTEATAFMRPLNGPPMRIWALGGWYETPCADGSYAFGEVDACGGHVVEYTTVAMMDAEEACRGIYELYREASARLHPLGCSEEVVLGWEDFDTSGYMLNGIFREYYGSIRSAAGIEVIVGALGE
jgi:hypothetical protein